MLWARPDSVADERMIYLQLAGVENEPDGREPPARLEIVLGERYVVGYSFDNSESRIAVRKETRRWLGGPYRQDHEC